MSIRKVDKKTSLNQKGIETMETKDIANDEIDVLGEELTPEEQGSVAGGVADLM